MWKSSIERKYQHCRSITMGAVILWVQYNGIHKIPDGISPSRWRGIIKFINCHDW